MEWKAVPETWQIRPPPPGFPRAGDEPGPESLEPDVLSLSGPEEFRIRVALARLALGGADGQSSFHASRTLFKPYQYRPLLRYLSNPRGRILIADETGLGKTIEAGYILLEELSRRPLQRIVIVCPANLLHKWRWELWWRFGLAFELARGREFLRRLQGQDDGFHLIVSMDAMRGHAAELRSTLGEPNLIDFLVVDEVHHAIGRNGETLRREFALLCSLAASRVVALSATPILLAAEDLKRVLEVVDPAGYGGQLADYALRLNAAVVEAANALEVQALSSDRADFRDVVRRLHDFSTDPSAREAGFEERSHKIVELMSSMEVANLSAADMLEIRDKIRELSPFAHVLNRTRRADIGESRERIVKSRPVALSRAERSAFQEGGRVIVTEHGIFDEVQKVFRSRFSHNHVRQLASSLPAAAELLRLGAVGHHSWDDIVDEDVTIADRGKRAPLSDGDRETCARLYAKVRLLAGDTKWDALKEEIDRLSEQEHVYKFVVFTHWRPTLGYFKRKSSDLQGFGSYFVSGNDSDVQRFQTLRKFEGAEGKAVLFTTDIMSEGVDIVSAGCVVNYDLPYNPQVLEQRIGRIDRVGQQANRIFVLNITVVDSSDEKVLQILDQRIGWSEEQLGMAAAVFPYQQKELTEEELEEYTQALESYRQSLETDLKNALVREQPDFLGPLLDREVAGIEGSGSWVQPEERAAILNLFFEVAGEGAASLSRPSNTALSFEKASPGFELALARMAGERHFDEVRSQLLYALANGASLTTRPSEEGVFLPSAHPLFQAVVRVLGRSMPPEPCRALASGRIPGLEPGSYTAVVSHLTFRGQTRWRSSFSIAWTRDSDGTIGSTTTSNPARWLEGAKLTETRWEVSSSSLETLKAATLSDSSRLFGTWRMVERNLAIEECKRAIGRALRRAELGVERKESRSGRTPPRAASSDVEDLRTRLELLETTPEEEFGVGETVILGLLRIHA